MFEIKKNDFLYFRMLPDEMKASKNSIYDFTFEDRFIIYHYRDHVKNHYIALDKTTGYGSYVLASRDTLDDKSYPMMIPAILYSIKYTGDRRMNMEAQVDNDDWVSMIFRCLLPQIGFSIREEQVEMANKMYAGLTGKKITLCEAGVGTGKTMSYLAAGFAAARVKKDYQYASNPITISTSSIDLQREIIEKEIPRLSQVLMDAGIIKKPLRSVLRKGKEHYFCLRRYADYVQAIEGMGEKYSRTLELLDMLDLPSNGFDLDQVQIPSHIKAKICVSGSCHKCPYRNGCQYAQFVKRASEKGVYDIQVTNHNLLLTSQKMKATAGVGVLLDSNYYIIDEAHKLVEAANSVYGAQITPATIPELLNSVKYACKKDGVKEAYRDLLKVTKDMNANLFLKVGRLKDDAEDDRCSIELSDRTRTEIADIVSNLEQIRTFQTDENKKRACTMLIDNLSMFVKKGENLCWLELDKATDTLSLCCVPIAMRSHLNKSLWSMPNTHWVLTSGTMRDDTGFDYFKDELGISGNVSDHAILEHSNGSPFDYRKHTRLYISENIPLPNMDDPNYIQAVSDEIVHLVRATHGHTAILFTSYRMLRQVYEQVKDRLKEYPLIQMTRSDKTAIAEFKKSQNGVLFASGSMWEGVDCAGDVLSSVIIVRLPFPLRSQLMEYKKNQYDTVGEFVQECAIPQMIIKLRQGAGRLVRTEKDTGIIAILDSRASRKGSYRSRVLNALKQYPLTSSIQGVASFIRSVKDEDYTEGGKRIA